MGFEMRSIDHQAVGLAAICRQFGKNPVEHPNTVPADEAAGDLSSAPSTPPAVCEQARLKMAKAYPKPTAKDC
jgi:hypothetical protein